MLSSLKKQTKKQRLYKSFINKDKFYDLSLVIEELEDDNEVVPELLPGKKLVAQNKA